MTAMQLLTDQPVSDGGSQRRDGLGFELYAQVLGDAARGARGPFTIGVFGDWGSGKTSLMRLLQRELDRHEPHVVTVWFNAWRYEQEQHPIVPLVGTIVRALAQRAPTHEAPSPGVQRLIRALRAVAYGFSAKSTVKIPGFAEVEASFVAKEMIDRYSSLTQDPLLSRSLYYEAFEGLEAARFSDELTVVVLVDDLDRCFPDQAIRLLESIKLVLAQEGFVFVLGVARQVIEGYLQHRYSTEYGIADYPGQLYLDKMVQLPFHIPPSGHRVEQLCKALLEEEPPEVAHQLADVLPLAGEALGGNPRAVIRFLNNLLVDLAISRELAEPPTPAIPIQFFALSRCLQQRWPEVFSELLADPMLAGVVSAWDRDAIRAAAAGGGAGSTVALAMLADRPLENLLQGTEGKRWLEETELRLASVDFLYRQHRVGEGGGQSWDYDAFISFAPADRRAASQVAEKLADYGLRVYMQRPDESSNISAVTGCRSMCVLLGASGTPTEQQSRYLHLATTPDRPDAPTDLTLSAVVIKLPGFPDHGAEADAAGPELVPLPSVDLRAGIEVKSIRPLVDRLRR